MYDTIQSILTYLIEAITIIGFLSCWVHYCATTTLIEIRSWGTPQPLSKSANKPHKMKQNDSNKFTDSTITNELKTTNTTHNNIVCDDSPISDTAKAENQPPIFEDYSQRKLLKIARTLGIRRYTQMQRSDLVKAIAAHPEVQRVCTQ